MENDETLHTTAIFHQFANFVACIINHFLSNSVVTSSIVVGSILLASDQLLRVEKLSVGSSADFIDDSGLQINKYCSWDVFASASLSEECGEGVIATH